MNTIWGKINKLLGIINLILGFTLLYNVIKYTNRQFYLIQTISVQQNFSKNQISFFDLLISNWFFLLIAILFVVSGILILIKNRFGWFFGYCCWIILIFALNSITIYRIRDVTITVIGDKHWIQIYGGLGLLLSFIVLILFSLYPIRKLNIVSNKFWIQSLVFTVLLYLLSSF